MKQFPKFIKYRKNHKPNIFFKKILANKEFFIINGQFGIQSLESGKVTFKQIEASRRTLKRNMNKSGFFWIKMFTNIPVTKKSLASRMGKGKGNISHWICLIKKGQVLFEMGNIDESKAIFALNKTKSKLPIKTKIIKLLY